MRAARAAAGVLLLVGLLAGCGGGPAVGEVSGTVTYDGQTVETGSIAFHPADGNGPSAGGAITNGKYTVANVPVGTAKVRISGTRVKEKRRMFDAPEAPVVDISDEYLPGKYSNDKTTELRYDVQAGSQTKNFELTR
jgi:hypothetical protein